ncbi:hypothetical protein [Stratiformator vulcanicus]|uniref:Uncharacterized protein n=1 Tax=Stratiformator vulcanicus TaxID=2527980 RepID=A0A517R468_9PLAN|nr:hypothetical protein [Stratiformator vulcanicus]QDT38666.1 hypothetical protein Pan189_30620 [Stratiformator vulcanicus]
MTIEFDCPNCGVAIRVDDSAAGKKGSCPKCRMKLRVPAIAPADEPPEPDPPTAPPAAVPDQPVAAAPEAPPEQIASPPVPPTETPAFNPAEFLTVEEESVTGRTTKHRRKRGRGRSSGLIFSTVVAVVCGLMIAVVVYRYAVDTGPRLTGEAVAAPSARAALPPKSIVPPAAGLPEESVALVMQALQPPGVPFKSRLMELRFVAAENAILVSVAESSATTLFAVPLGQESKVAAIVRLNRQQVAALKYKERRDEVLQFFRVFSNTLRNGEAIVPDDQGFRDTVGLNALTGVLGYSVEAVAEGRVYRCVYEDESGRIYFALPELTTEFQIRGRVLPDGSTPIPLDYQVTVAEQSLEPPRVPERSELIDSEAGDVSEAGSVFGEAEDAASPAMPQVID